MSGKSKSLSPIIFGCAGLKLTAEEHDFFSQANPAGFILFSRNCGTPRQVKDLTDDLRQSVGWAGAPVLIDLEGGKVARIRPPHWPEFPAARAYGQIYEKNPQKAETSVYIGARLMAHELLQIGVNVNCLPVLDVPAPDADEVIGTRAYSEKPAIVARLGQCAASGLKAGGVAPVIKHMPGHGRARADSHKTCPIVDASFAELEADFMPFRALSDQPIGMTAHLIYTALDPDNPATLSRSVIGDILRGEIGFSGLLLSDDIGMGALSGSVLDRGAAALAAGCDIVLHCSGDLDEMRMLAAHLPPASPDAVRRLDDALNSICADDISPDQLWSQFHQALKH